MKKLLFLILSVSIVSCISTYYQMSDIKTNPQKMQSNNVYEDSVLKITYNFWSVGGTLKFDIYNKLNVPNFILNGQSVEYTENNMMNPTALKSDVVLASVAGTEHFVSIASREQINSQLPPHSYISVNKFALNVPYYSIGYYPKISDSTVYTYDNSIMHFRNYIGYTTKQDMTNLKFVDNEFWVGKVTTFNGRYFNENKPVPAEFYNSFER